MTAAFNLTAQLNLKGPSNIGSITSSIKKQLGTITANVDVKVNATSIQKISQLNAGLQQLNKTLSATTVSATSAASAIKGLGQAFGAVNLSSLPQQISATSTALGQVKGQSAQAAKALAASTTQMEEFGKQSALAVRRFAAFSIVTSSIYALNNSINRGIEAFIEYDQQFVKLQQVTGQSADGLKSLSKEITTLSVGLGVSSAALTDVASTLAQAGLSAQDTEKALKALALSSLAPSFDSMNETVEGSIAIMRQFGISAGGLEGALGSINTVAAKFAVEARDIITAVQRTGGVFATASKGVTEGTDALNEFVAVFTSIRATTRESAETIATGLRTIFTRIQRGSTIDALKEFGVNLQDTEGKFVGAYKAVELLSKGLSSLDPRDAKFSKIVEELGGFRQIGKVIPLIQQFSVAQNALKVAQQGQGSLAKDAATAQLSLANQIQKVRQEFLALFREMGQSQGFQVMVKATLSLASGLIKVVNASKGLLPLLGVMLAFKGASAITQFASGFGQGLKPGAGKKDREKPLFSQGGPVRAFATGGVVPGSGDGDTVPAMLTPGEFVIKKQAVKAIGANKLHSINRYATGGKVKDLVNDPNGKKSLKKVYDINQDFDSYEDPTIDRVDLDKTYDQYTQQSKQIWLEANKKYKQDLAEGYKPQKGDIPKLANAYIKRETGGLAQNLGFKELREPQTAKKLNKIRGALAENEVKKRYKLGNPLALQDGADFYDAKNERFVEIKNQKKQLKDSTLISKTLLAFAARKGNKLNNQPDHVPSLKILAVEAPSPDKYDEFEEKKLGGVINKRAVRAVESKTFKNMNQYAGGGAVVVRDRANTDDTTKLDEGLGQMVNQASRQFGKKGAPKFINAKDMPGYQAIKGHVFEEGLRIAGASAADSAANADFDYNPWSGNKSFSKLPVSKTPIVDAKASLGSASKAEFIKKISNFRQKNPNDNTTNFGAAIFENENEKGGDPEDIKISAKEIAAYGQSKNSGGLIQRFIDGGWVKRMQQQSPKDLNKELDLLDSTLDLFGFQRKVPISTFSKSAPFMEDAGIKEVRERISAIKEFLASKEPQKKKKTEKEITLPKAPSGISDYLRSLIEKNKIYDITNQYDGIVNQALNAAYKGNLGPGNKQQNMDKVGPKSMVRFAPDREYIDVSLGSLEKDIQYIDKVKKLKGEDSERLAANKGYTVSDMLDTVRAYQAIGLDAAINTALGRKDDLSQSLADTSDLNKTERKKLGPAVDQPLSYFVGSLDAAMQFSLPEKLYSGIGASKQKLFIESAGVKINKLEDTKKLVGKTVSIPSFLSTSEVLDTAESFVRTGMMTIETNKKAKGLNPERAKTDTINRDKSKIRKMDQRLISDSFVKGKADESFADDYDIESEYILPRNSKFKVKNIEAKDNSEEGGNILESLNMDWAVKMLNRGGKVQKFVDGGVAQRKVGYIDYDVIANETNKDIVEKGMEATGQKGPRLYTDYLTQLAVRARKDNSLQKLRAIYGVAGSGKTTLARGQGTDNATLRKTDRFPVLSPEDIQKATEILILTSSVSQTKMDDFFSDVDRAYTLSSTTDAERQGVRSRKESRDITGIGLENRKPGTTMGVSTDSAVGEALLSDKLGSKSTVLGRSDSGRLRRKRGNELVDIIKKRIGFTWGGFSPMTAGHESIMEAASAMGIPPEDFIYLVGANEGITDDKASSFRTAIFDQDARVLLAKAGAGAKGATVLPKPRDFEVPQAFDISPESGRRKVLIPGKGSTAFVADKTAKDLEKYTSAGYSTVNLERYGGISGTMVRDLIAEGNLGELQKILSPGVYDLISNNIGRIQNRAKILPTIVADVQKSQTVKLKDVESEIKAIGISRIDQKKMDDPEYAAKAEILLDLREKKKKIQTAGSFEPYKLLDALAQKDPQNYALDFSSPTTMANVPDMRVMGQGPQAPEAPMPVGRVAQLAQEKNKSIQDVILEQLGGLGGPAGVKKILGIGSGDRTLSSLLQAGNIKGGKGLEQAADYVNRALAARGIRDAAEAKRLEEYQAKALHFGIAGLLPMDYSKEFEWDIGGTSVYATARGFGSAYLEEARQMQNESSALAQRFAENIQNKNIFGGGERLAFDFDKTLVEDADILDAKGNPDIKKYANRDAVQQALQNARPTRLAVKLKSLIEQDPPFIKKTRILTARPQSTADLLAQSLQSFGLPYSEQDITGVSGGASSNIAVLKAANLQQEEKLIDDNLENIMAVRKAGKKGFQYIEPKPTTSELDEKMGQGNIEGAVVEKALAVLGAPVRPNAKQNRAIDYPDGLGSAAQFFPGIDPGIPTEVKRTIDGSSLEKVREEIGRYITGGAEAVKLARGGAVQSFMAGGRAAPQSPPRKFADGGLVPGIGNQDTVPATLNVGDFVIRKKAVETIGVSKLAGMSRYASGGSVDKVPALLTPGEFVFNRQSAQKIGYNKLHQLNHADKIAGYNNGGMVGGVQGYASGGAVTINSAIEDLITYLAKGMKATSEANPPKLVARPDIVGRATLQVSDKTVEVIKAISKELNDLGVSVSHVAELMKIGGDISYKAMEKAIKKDIERMTIAGASIEQLSKAESTLAVVRTERIENLKKTQTLEDSFRNSSIGQKFGSGGAQQQIISESDRLEKLIENKKIKDISKTLNTGPGGMLGASSEDIRKKATELASSPEEKAKTKQSAYITAAAKVTGVKVSDFKSAELSGADIQKYIAESMRDRKTLADMDKQLIALRMEEYKNVSTVRGISVNSAKEARALADEEVSQRRGIIDDLASAQGEEGVGPSGIWDLANSVIVKKLQGLTPSDYINGGATIAGFMSGNGNAIAQNFYDTSDQGRIGAARTGAAISSAGTIASTGLGIAAQSLALGPIGPVVAGIVAAGTGILALTDSIYDFTGSQEAAVKEVEKSLRATEINAATASLDDAFKKFENDMSNIDLQEALNNALSNSVMAQAKDTSANIDQAKEDYAYQNRSWGDLLNFDLGGSAQMDAVELKEVNRVEAERFAPLADKAYKQIQNEINGNASIEQIMSNDKLRGARAAIAMSTPEGISEYTAQKAAEEKATGKPITEDARQAIIDEIAARKISTNEFIISSIKAKEVADALEMANLAGRKLAQSFQRLYDSIDQAINKNNFNIQQRKTSTDYSTGALSGNAVTPELNSKNINILDNPKAYSTKEFNSAINVASQSLPAEDAAMIKGAATLQRNLAPAIEAELRKTLRTDAGLTAEDAAKQAKEIGTAQVKAKGLPVEMEEAIINQLNASIDAKVQDDKVQNEFKNSPQAATDKFIESIREASDTIIENAGKGGIDTLKKLLSSRQDIFNDFGKNLAKSSAFLKQHAESLVKAKNIIGDAKMNLREALTGVGETFAEAKARFDSEISDLTGGITDPKAIRANIQNLEKKGAALVEQRKNTDDEAAIAKFTTEINKTNDAINNNREGLERLANSSELAAKALGEVTKIRDLQKNRSEVVNKLLTQTPEEAQKLNDTFVRLQNNLSGGLNTGANSRAAREAFSQALRSGSSLQGAYRAGNSVLAQQRQETLAMFQDPNIRGAQKLEMKNQAIRQNKTLSDEQIEDILNQQEAQLKTQMAIETGQINNPMVRADIEATKNRKFDPAAAQAADEYNKITNRQANANTEIGGLALVQSRLVKSNDELKIALEGLTLEIQNARGFDAKVEGGKMGAAAAVAAGKGATVGASPAGGNGPRTVYASTGALINFEPKGTDTVPAMLTPGEFVINARSTAEHLPLLQAINNSRGGSIDGFSNGGIVYAQKGILVPTKRETSLSADYTRLSRVQQGNITVRGDELTRGSYRATLDPSVVIHRAISPVGAPGYDGSSSSDAVRNPGTPSRTQAKEQAKAKDAGYNAMAERIRAARSTGIGDAPKVSSLAQQMMYLPNGKVRPVPSREMLDKWSDIDAQAGRKRQDGGHIAVPPATQPAPAKDAAQTRQAAPNSNKTMQKPIQWGGFGFGSTPTPAPVGGESQVDKAIKLLRALNLGGDASKKESQATDEGQREPKTKTSGSKVKKSEQTFFGGTPSQMASPKFSLPWLSAGSNFPKPRNMAEIQMYKEGLSRGMTIQQVRDERIQAYRSRFPSRKNNRQTQNSQAPFGNLSIFGFSGLSTLSGGEATSKPSYDTTRTNSPLLRPPKEQAKVIKEEAKQAQEPLAAAPSLPVAAAPSLPVAAAPSLPVAAAPSLPVAAAPSLPVAAGLDREKQRNLDLAYENMAERSRAKILETIGQEGAWDVNAYDTAYRRLMRSGTPTKERWTTEQFRQAVEKELSGMSPEYARRQWKGVTPSTHYTQSPEYKAKQEKKAKDREVKGPYAPGLPGAIDKAADQVMTGVVLPITETVAGAATVLRSGSGPEMDKKLKENREALGADARLAEDEKRKLIGTDKSIFGGNVGDKVYSKFLQLPIGQQQEYLDLRKRAQTKKGLRQSEAADLKEYTRLDYFQKTLEVPYQQRERIPTGYESDVKDPAASKKSSDKMTDMRDLRAATPLLGSRKYVEGLPAAFEEGATLGTVLTKESSAYGDRATETVGGTGQVVTGTAKVGFGLSAAALADRVGMTGLASPKIVKALKDSFLETARLGGTQVQLGASKYGKNAGVDSALAMVYGESSPQATFYADQQKVQQKQFDTTFQKQKAQAEALAPGFGTSYERAENLSQAAYGAATTAAMQQVAVGAFTKPSMSPAKTFTPAENAARSGTNQKLNDVFTGKKQIVRPSIDIEPEFNKFLKRPIVGELPPPQDMALDRFLKRPIIGERPSISSPELDQFLGRTAQTPVNPQLQNIRWAMPRKPGSAVWNQPSKPSSWNGASQPSPGPVTKQLERLPRVRAVKNYTNKYGNPSEDSDLVIRKQLDISRRQNVRRFMNGENDVGAPIDSTPSVSSTGTTFPSASPAVFPRPQIATPSEPLFPTLTKWGRSLKSLAGGIWNISTPGNIFYTGGSSASLRYLLSGGGEQQDKPQTKKVKRPQRKANVGMISTGYTAEGKLVPLSFGPTAKYSTGGIVYANNGALIETRSQGTDTVPAMLTPGEFVVNRASAQEHMPLLQAINNRNYESGGLVKYMAQGGVVTPQYKDVGGAIGSLASSSILGAGLDMGAISELAKELPRLKQAFGSFEKLSEFTQSFDKLTQNMGTNLTGFAETVANMPRQMEHSLKAIVNGTINSNIPGATTQIVNSRHEAQIVYDQNNQRLDRASEGAFSRSDPAIMRGTSGAGGTRSNA